MGAPMALVDLALPHDIDPAVGEVDGVIRIDLADLADELHASAAGREVAQGAASSARRWRRSSPRVAPRS